MTLDVQFITMISMIAGGFYLGMALDTFRRLSIYWKQRVFLIYFMEISFWLTQTMLLYYVLFLANSGELRFYVFLAVLLGFSMYRALAASAFKRLLEHVIRVIAAISRFLENMFKTVIVTPVKFIIQLLITIGVFTVNLLLSLVRYIFKIVFVPVFWLLRMIFRMLPQSIQKNLHKIAGFYSTIENTCKKWLKKLHHWMSKRR
ncbi:spore cortex biosynthesis protein YabQ [Lentibacillus sp. CBA3610]|uniref:spore cortex biosynthesis protein YabQ n=1 Tax=Lentibacillus sp. CBA3610 TaxID=2518176 RepID=UPI0015953D44|nr:spore cortex biosynthesis protein YabQ [Lentibacillus sp. CBA3610]QKY70901.1 spore cortex biosynthesis protein YabQ [Lentibacillus sp. CBA3610]